MAWLHMSADHLPAAIRKLPRLKPAYAGRSKDEDVILDFGRILACQ
jgi:hypothetical protein